MALTTAGVKAIAQSIAGSGTFFNNANTYIGVGNSAAAFSAAQTDLQGASKLRKKVDSGYPVVSAPTLTFRATFGTSDANFAWNEWGIFNASSGGTMLNRVVESNGTKQSNQTWILEVDITFAIGQ